MKYKQNTVQCARGIKTSVLDNKSITMCGLLVSWVCVVRNTASLLDTVCLQRLCVPKSRSWAVNIPWPVHAGSKHTGMTEPASSATHLTGGKSHQYINWMLKQDLTWERNVSLCQVCALTIKVAHKSNTNRGMVMCFCMCSYDAPATAFIHHTSLVHQKAKHAKWTVFFESQHSVVMIAAF